VCCRDRSNVRYRRYLAVDAGIGKGPDSTPSCHSMVWSRTPGFLPIPAVRGPLIEPRESTHSRQTSAAPQSEVLLLHRSERVASRSYLAFQLGLHPKPSFSESYGLRLESFCPGRQLLV
jgi:hypothetical protein